MKRLFAIICYISIHCSAYAQVGDFKFSSWKEFDLQGGYPAGDIVVIKKGYPQSPVLTRDRLMLKLEDKSILTYRNQRVPKHTFDKKKIFKSSVKVNAEKFNAEVSGSLNKVKSVKLNCEEGSRQYLERGSDAALIDLIRALPEEELEIISQALSMNKQVCFITEVLIYEKAALQLDFGFVLGAEAKVKLEEIVDLSGAVSQEDNGTLVIKYGTNSSKDATYVGYKAIDLKKHKKLIEEEIKKKRVNRS